MILIRKIIVDYGDLAIWFLVTLATTVIFLYAPNIDTQFSALFFDHNTMSFLFNSTMVKCANMFPIIVLALLISYIGASGIKKFITLKSINPKHYFIHIYILLTLIISRIVIYSLIKPLYCRPRPYIIQEFGGKEVFSPVLRLNLDKITSDDLFHSFVSGHATAVFSLYCIVFILSNLKLRVTVFGLVTVAGMVAGLGRIAIGQHFLSDIVYAMLLSYLIVRMLYILLNYIYTLKT